jgi:altronate dehydratase
MKSLTPQEKQQLAKVVEQFERSLKELEAFARAAARVGRAMTTAYQKAEATRARLESRLSRAHGWYEFASPHLQAVTDLDIPDVGEAIRTKAEEIVTDAHQELRRLRAAVAKLG